MSETKGGVLGWFVGHQVLANILMFSIIFFGLLAVRTSKIEVFPEYDTDMITIQVPYRGASPAESEEGVCIRVEEAIASIDGIKRLTATAQENLGVVSAELLEDADDQKVLDDIKAAVDRIETFPVETEKPIVSLLDTRRKVITVVLHGEASEKTIKVMADRIRDDLTAMDGITQVDITGPRRYEISIEVPEENLRRYGLSFQQVAAAVAGASLDMPGGSIKTDGGEILIRTKGQKYHGPEFSDIVVLSRADGTRVLLSDIATIVDAFEDSDTRSIFDGKPAALIQVSRVGDEDALAIAEKVKNYVAEMAPTLPLGVSLSTWDDTSIILKQRIGLLLRNARWGLILVFFCLAFFLNLRLAFWATLGIPISFLGGLAIVPHFGVSINMISLFAFIVVLGIVVDDAIVVGENIFHYLQQGFSPMDAAIRGVREMGVPVIFAVITTVAAFAPLLAVSGLMGKIMKQIPLVVIAVLLTSLFEALFILPSHLSHRPFRPRIFEGFLHLVERVQAWVDARLQAFIEGPYRKSLELSLRWRYFSMATAISLLLLIAGLVAGGHLKFTLMPRVDADNMIAKLEMPQGLPAEQTEAILRRIEKAAEEAGREIDRERPKGAQPVILHTSLSVGQQPSAGGHGPSARQVIGGTSSNIGEINVQLLSSDQRDVSSTKIVNLWRKKVGEIPGAVSLSFQASLFTPGAAISVQLSHQNFDTLLKAVHSLQNSISEYPGVKDVANSFVLGKRELKLRLTPTGRSLGLNLSDLARQVRAGFYGEEVQRIQRGRDDIRVMLRYPAAERRSMADIEDMRIRLPGGGEAPFSTVARLSEGRGYATINRADRRRVVTVSADVDPAVANANEINAQIRKDVLPRLVHDFPGLKYSFEGEQRSQKESMQSLFRNFFVAQFAIFALLAIPFRSYTQPLIVMSAIPFGLVGAVIGHLVMGMDLSMLSVFGMVALTGVVVNDSLIMVDLINIERRSGTSLDQAIRDSGIRRFRPIMLTTATTFLGLTPMILERSLQARFLIPMAVSLGFGIIFATAITLLLVPTLYRILEDFHQLGRKKSVDGGERERVDPPSSEPEITAAG